MKQIIIFNHKSYMLADDVLEYINDIKNKVPTTLDVVMLPSPIYMPYFNGKYNFILGSQTIDEKEVTGCISGAQLSSFNIKYALTNHHERETYLNEEKRLIAKRVLECILNNITPIIMVGETLEEYERQKTGDVILKQLKAYLSNINDFNKLVIVYEPNYKVTDDNIKSNKEISEIVDLIKLVIERKYKKTPIVCYGGGINEKTIKELNKIESLDGYIIGKASSNAKSACKLLDLVD